MGICFHCPEFSSLTIHQQFLDIRTEFRCTDPHVGDKNLYPTFMSTNLFDQSKNVLSHLFYSNCMLKLEEPSHSSSPSTTFPSSLPVRFENQVAWNKLSDITSKVAFFLWVSFSPAFIYIILAFCLHVPE